MLKLSPYQAGAISTQREAGFYENLREELRDFLACNLPEMEEDRAQGRITYAFEVCRAYGFVTEKQITELSYILVTFPSDYAHKGGYAWLDGLLRSNAPPETRLARIKGVIRGISA